MGAGNVRSAITRPNGRLAAATPYTLRHSLARCMIEHRADLGEVQRVLGHSSIATIERYLMPREEELREASGAGV